MRHFETEKLVQRAIIMPATTNITMVELFYTKFYIVQRIFRGHMPSSGQSAYFGNATT